MMHTTTTTAVAANSNTDTTARPKGTMTTDCAAALRVQLFGLTAEANADNIDTNTNSRDGPRMAL